ncbi:MAG TPA: filamentous hemagglutinin N-terminal domain-containing protein, partial [Desulfuromonadaceae bacterium]
MRKRGAAVVALAALLQGTALANPTGPQVISGQASFSATGTTLSITNSPNAIINWNSFSINPGELTRFIQQSSASAVLNRVIGGNASAIYGALQSNGKVFLINQNGILFGPGAQVNVNGLMASTLDIKNADFLAGRFRFFAGATAAGIENQGRITTPSGGSIYLIAPDIKNSGIITAPNGDIVLAAGHTVSLVDSGSPDIAAVVSAPADQALNLGQIIAQAGRIGIYGGIIAQKGIVSANSAVRDASGRIFFRATNDITLDTGSVTSANGAKGGGITIRSTEGTTLVSGAVEAAGSNGSSGTVKLLGQQVGLIDRGSINVSGTSGGGTALVGGGYHGQDPSVQNARKTYVGADTSIKADATDKGNGGTVIVWSDDATRAYGAISARGGANGGNGGFVETSGHNYLDFQGRVDTGAPRGSAGTLLLDPADITIDNSTDNLAGGTLGGGYFQNATTNSTLTWSTINTQTGSLEIRTNSSGTGGNGDININANGSITGPTTLTLLANNNINIAAGVSVNGGSADLNLVAGW